MRFAGDGAPRQRKLVGEQGGHVGRRIIDGIVDRIRQARHALLDLLRRQRGIAENDGPAGQGGLSLEMHPRR
jgi:hypothetical protein